MCTELHGFMLRINNILHFFCIFMSTNVNVVVFPRFPNVCLFMYVNCDVNYIPVLFKTPESACCSPLSFIVKTFTVSLTNFNKK